MPFARKPVLIILILMALAVLALHFFEGRPLSEESRSLRVAFPLAVLKKDPTLLNPRDTATTWEYYLLENLAVGLVRDDAADPRGYASGIASAWSQPSPDTWLFEIRPDLRWSDGSAITAMNVAEFLRNLPQSGARHIEYLKSLKSVSVRPDGSTLELLFSRPVGVAVLHELSLADATLIHPTNTNRDWSITSGPYYVESYDPEAPLLKLRRNPHGKTIWGDDYPEAVELFWTAEADFTAFFRQRQADIFTSGAFSFRHKVTSLDQVAPQRIPGTPTVVYYFEIDKDTDGADRNLRRAFARLTQEYFATAQLPPILRPERQVIPAGYFGHVPDWSGLAADEVDMRVLAGKSMSIWVFPQMAELSGIFDGLSAQAAKAGLKLEFVYGNAQNQAPARYFARTQVFKGNQKDASGTWSFLFSGSSNLTRKFRSDTMPWLDAFYAAVDDASRQKTSTTLHRRTLEEAYVIPFFREFTPVYTSGRVNLDRWNPFDMRLRFYDVRWR